MSRKRLKTHRGTYRTAVQEYAKDHMYQVRLLEKEFNSIVKDVYTPDQDISVNQETMPQTGRNSCHQMTNTKRGQFGFKNLVINESTGYCCRVKVYAGKGSIEPKPAVLQPESVVLEMIEGPENKGYMLDVDRGYGTAKLAEMIDELGSDILAP